MFEPINNYLDKKTLFIHTYTTIGTLYAYQVANITIMNKTGKWGLALGIATGAVLALTLSTRSGKKTKNEGMKKVTKSDIKAAPLVHDDSEIHYV